MKTIIKAARAGLMRFLYCILALCVATSVHALPYSSNSKGPTSTKNANVVTYPFFIDTVPQNAKVRIMNIGPSYQFGMPLASGRYKVEVSEPGFETQTQWFDLGADSQFLMVRLVEIPQQDASTYTVGNASFAIKTIPRGRFMMGCVSGDSECADDEKPRHPVNINEFALMETEVTFALWDECVRARGCTHSPSDEGWGRGDRPVTNISYNDITNEFIPWLNRATGKRFRLPSEAEWEYAARAGATTIFSWGNSVGRNNAVCDGCGSSWDDTSTAPVKSLSPNQFGLYDMIGNLREWTADCGHREYTDATYDGSAWTTASCGIRILRGGSWYQLVSQSRASYRFWDSPDERNNNQGFRLVLEN